jgi:hypothetical protein
MKAPALLAGLTLFAAACNCGAPLLPGPDGGLPPDSGSPDSGFLPDGGSSCSRTPTLHYATDPACRMTRGPGIDTGSDAGGLCAECCNRDSDCTAGLNGRCGYFHNGPPICSYDECFKNEDCDGGYTCFCGGSDGTNATAANRCLPSNCRLDSDCSEGCGCSPTYDTTCGIYDGYVGVFCHRPNDECTVDSDCHQDTDAGSLFGFCAFSGAAAHWVCAYAFCSG